MPFLYNIPVFKHAIVVREFEIDEHTLDKIPALKINWKIRSLKPHTLHMTW